MKENILKQDALFFSDATFQTQKDQNPEKQKPHIN
jgi:sulfur relay (sulfurtransferase) DsrF/TusC family protein